MTVVKKKGSTEQLSKRIHQSIGDEVRIGFFAEDRYEDGLSVAQVAKYNDQGVTIYIPPRPFMSEGLRSVLKSRPYLKMYATHIQKVLSGKMTMKALYSSIGQYASDDLKEVIYQWSSPPNSARTIANKGFNDPLIHTGKMRESAKYKIGKSRKTTRMYKMRKTGRIK